MPKCVVQKCVRPKKRRDSAIILCDFGFSAYFENHESKNLLIIFLFIIYFKKRNHKVENGYQNAKFFGIRIRKRICYMPFFSNPELNSISE